MSVGRYTDLGEKYLSIAPELASGRTMGRTKDKILTTRFGGLAIRDTLTGRYGGTASVLRYANTDG